MKEMIQLTWAASIQIVEAATKQRDAINEVIRNGAREIPGLRIWEEIDTNVRR